MIYSPHKTTSFVVREFLLKVNKTHSALIIGIPKENIMAIGDNENDNPIYFKTQYLLSIFKI